MFGDDRLVGSPRVLASLLDDSEDVEASLQSRRASSDQATPSHGQHMDTSAKLRATLRTLSASYVAHPKSPGGALERDHSSPSPSFNGENGEANDREVDYITDAVVDAVADAVGEAVTEAVQKAVDTRFDTIRANFYTLVAVMAAVLVERGVWNCWDYFFGATTLLSSAGSFAVGVTILIIVRLINHDFAYQMRSLNLL